MDLPSYEQLPIDPTKPPGSSWGVWGADDELGTLNLLTDERRAAAAALVHRGATFNLQLPLEEPAAGVVWRDRPRHHILHVGHEARDGQPGGADDPSAGFVDRDDYVDGLWLQGSSQWDGLTHVRHPEHGNYNGVPDDQVHGGPGTRLGIDRWAERGVVGRAVVLDVQRELRRQGEPLDLDAAFEVAPELLDATAAAQGTSVQEGDVLLVHTGWLHHLLSAPAGRQATMLDPRQQQVPGLEVSERTLAWLWDHHVAAVAADNVGVEACGEGLRFDLHPSLLALLGIPLGEYWWLHDLAADCADDGRYEAMLVSVPLNLRGAVGSPAQALALK